MDSALGSLLRSRRLERRMSLRGLAATAGVGLATVSRWEAGAFLPRVVELEAVLNALGITGAQRDEALMHLNAPRAVKHLRKTPGASLVADEIGPMLSSGDLLRAMRHRRGLRREQAAVATGASPGTVRRWEQGKAAPPPDRMETLLDLLGAFPQEREVLRDGVSFLLPPLEEQAASPEALREVCRPSLWPHYELHPSLRTDLAYLSFAAQARLFAARSAEGRRLLAEVLANYASFLVWRDRYEEAMEFADRTLELTADEVTLSAHTLRAVFVACRARYMRRRLAPGGAVRTLQDWLPRAMAVPEKHVLSTWTLGQMGEYLGYDGRHDQALAAHNQARAIAFSHDDEAEMKERDNAKARLLIQTGRPAAALAVLETESGGTPSYVAELAVCRAECFQALGSVSDAQEWLAVALPEIRAHDLAQLEPRVVTLAQTL